jgi:hypothetical protein
VPLIAWVARRHDGAIETTRWSTPTVVSRFQ